MNRQEAKKIVREQNPTWKDIKDVLRKARSDMPEEGWRSRSVINKSFSKGATFNVFWKGLVSKPNDKRVMSSGVWFVAANVIREFGELSGYKVKRKTKTLPDVHHEEPIEINDD